MGQHRLRIFAGPNGSGKSTIVRSIRAIRVGDRPIDFGKYVNADDIVQELSSAKGLHLRRFGVPTDHVDFHAFARVSGLIAPPFDWQVFEQCHSCRHGVLQASNGAARNQVERLAQLVAAYLVDQLLASGSGFSFETVFSHKSKVDLMRKARDLGYKVYLYYVATESELINVERVAIRVANGGHGVPEQKIIERYQRSLELLRDGIAACHQAFLFDNSQIESRLFARYDAQQAPGQRWQASIEELPYWFVKHYLGPQG